MASQGMPMPVPDQRTANPTMSEASQGQGGPQRESQPPSEGQASQLQMLLARWYQVAKQMAASDPRLAEGAELVSQGIQKMQTALISPPQPASIGQQPSF